jgi:hypothetical protein
MVTCKNDSTTLTADTIITLIQDKKCKGYCQKYLNPDCLERPEYIDFLEFWPTRLWLDFKKGYYFFLHSVHPTYPKIKYGDKGFSVTYWYDSGDIKFDKKEHTLTLISNRFKWTRTFNVIYDKKGQKLLLRTKNGY